MAYIKWRRNRPFVYKSTRETETIITTKKGKPSARDGKQKIVSDYLGSYQRYREARPCGTFESLVKNETRLKWMAEYPDRLKMLHLIDEGVYQKFERDRS